MRLLVVIGLVCCCCRFVIGMQGRAHCVSDLRGAPGVPHLKRGREAQWVSDLRGAPGVPHLRGGSRDSALEEREGSSMGF